MEIKTNQKSLLGLICIGLISIVAALLIIYFAKNNNYHFVSVQYNHSLVRQIKSKWTVKPTEVSLIAVGDIMLSRDVDSTMKKRSGYGYPFEKTKQYLQTGDIVFGNLEAPITAGRSIATEEMVFRADIEVAPALKDAGFNVFSLANNHIMNFGINGLEDTKKYLDEQNIKYAPDKESVSIEVNGLKFVFLAYSYNFGLNEEKLAWHIKEQKKSNDFIIISMHAGTEYTPTPNNEQVNFAHTAIDAGADLVIGHHPHVTQTVEKYKDKYIFYSLGNFVFDQMWSEETKKGLIAKIIFTAYGVSKIELEDVYIQDFAQPNFSEKSDSIYDRLDFDAQSQNQGEYKIIKSEQDKYFLENGIFIIKENDQIIYSSPSTWWVDDFVIADSNNDGQDNINLLVWKPGDYGQSMPFWEQENDMSIKQHLFVYDTDMKAIWQSSNLDNPNCNMNFYDKNGDGEIELIVEEGEYRDDFVCETKYNAVWKWQEWGFYLLNRV